MIFLGIPPRLWIPPLLFSQAIFPTTSDSFLQTELQMNSCLSTPSCYHKRAHFTSLFFSIYFARKV